MRTIRHFAVLVAALALAVAPVAATGAAGVVKSRTTPSVGTQLAELEGSNFFGFSVAMSGKTVIVGAPGNTAYGAPGAAYVFTKTSTGWNQVAELQGSDLDMFGYSVAISGTTAMVGAPGYAKNAGRVYVFTKTAAGWMQVAELKGSDTVANDSFGWSVAISGTTAIVGAMSGHSVQGRAYVFTKTSTG